MSEPSGHEPVTEYTGQLVGGPDEGNLISSTVERVPFQCRYTYWSDGPAKMPSSFTVHGDYVWNEDDGVFEWKLDYTR
jgi:hypothetical protein